MLDSEAVRHSRLMVLMDIKDAVVVVGAIALAACLCWYFYYYPIGKDFFFGRDGVSYSDANSQLQSAASVCLVENISGLVDPIRKNVMDCGIDFASSLGGIKGVDAYVIEGSECTSLNGVGAIADCAREIHAKGCYIIFIGKNDTAPKTLNGLVYVPIGESDVNGSCSVRVSS
jgi:hypothetical protein